MKGVEPLSGGLCGLDVGLCDILPSWGRSVARALVRHFNSSNRACNRRRDIRTKTRECDTGDWYSTLR